MNAGLVGGLILGLKKAKEKSVKDIFNNQIIINDKN
tara:strand:- start:379 stop:486 length:108 start_codon:yes stop_codon:yes gene_type:complete